MAFPGDRDQPDHGFTVAGDHDILACESALDEPRELILGLQHVDLHASSTAQYSWLGQLSQGRDHSEDRRGFAHMAIASGRYRANRVMMINGFATLAILPTN